MSDHTMLDEEVEHTARALADDISFLLDERDIQHETHVEWDGDEGWHVIITAGHKVHGSPLREYTLTYSTAERRWLYQSIDEDGEQDGPHEHAGLANASANEVAEDIAAYAISGVA